MDTYSSSTESKTMVDEAKNLLKIGDYVGVFDAVQNSIESSDCDPELIHLAVLSLARSGATNQAMDLFNKLKSLLPENEEILTLEARLFKDIFLNTTSVSKRLELGTKARDIYLKAYKLRNHYYPGINAATLSYLIDDTDQSKFLAEEVIQICEEATIDNSEEDYYIFVTHAEACLLSGKDERANKLLQKARDTYSNNYGNLNTTFRQLMLICAKRGISNELIEPIRPPAVITYTGQMIHGLGKSPGIDPIDEPNLRIQIRDLLKTHKVKIAYGSLACGADLMVAEEILDSGGELNLILPFSKQEFKEISVSPAGPEWDERFDKTFSKATSVTYIVDQAYIDMDILFEACSLQGMGMAHLRSQTLGSKAYQIALWNGLPAPNKAGTKGAIERWENLGLQNLIIKVPVPKIKSPPVNKTRKKNNTDLRRQMKSMIFADIKGYSKLMEAQLPKFVTQWLKQLNAIAGKNSNEILYVNTWGDAIFMVVNSVSAAAKISLGLANIFPPSQLDTIGLPKNLGLRVAAHIGPIFETSNPVTGQIEYFGTHVVKTARLEPCTPVRSVYVTEPFAALLSIEANGEYGCEYVGNQPLPKNSGNIRMYNLIPNTKPSSFSL
ncbi:MAG: tetratricopeptide repeat-containing protein [Nitrospinales bacterium]